MDRLLILRASDISPDTSFAYHLLRAWTDFCFCAQPARHRNTSPIVRAPFILNRNDFLSYGADVCFSRIVCNVMNIIYWTKTPNKTKLLFSPICSYYKFTFQISYTEPKPQVKQIPFFSQLFLFQISFSNSNLQILFLLLCFTFKYMILMRMLVILCMSGVNFLPFSWQVGQEAAWWLSSISSEAAWWPAVVAIVQGSSPVTVSLKSAKILRRDVVASKFDQKWAPHPSLADFSSAFRAFLLLFSLLSSGTSYICSYVPETVFYPP